MDYEHESYQSLDDSLNYIGSYAYYAFNADSGLVHVADNMMGAYSLWDHNAKDYSIDQNKKHKTHSFMDTKCIKKILHNKNFVFYLLGILWIGILSYLLYSGCRPRNFYDENENLYVSAIYKYTNSADYVLICLGKTKDDIKKRKDCFLVSYGRGRDDDDDFASFYKVKNQDSIFIECQYSDVWIIRSSNFYMERKYQSAFEDYIKENPQSVWEYVYFFDCPPERLQIVDGFHTHGRKTFTHFIFELKE